MEDKMEYTKEEINLATFGVKDLEDIYIKKISNVKLMTKETMTKTVPRGVPTFFSVQCAK